MGGDVVGVAGDHLVDLVECVHLATEGGYLEQTQDHLQPQLNNVMLGGHPPGQVSQGLWEERGGEGRGGEGRGERGREEGRGGRGEGRGGEEIGTQCVAGTLPT